VGETAFLTDSAGVSKNPMRILGSYALIYILAGGGQFRDSNGFETEVSAGDMILIFPMWVILMALLATATGTSSMQFLRSSLRLVAKQQILNDAEPILHLHPVDFWRKRLSGIQDIAQVSTGNDAQKALRQICALQNVLADALAAQGSETSSEERAWLQRARQLLSNDSQEGQSSPRLHIPRAKCRCLMRTFVKGLQH
jgi:hypothetical protein